MSLSFSYELCRSNSISAARRSNERRSRILIGTGAYSPRRLDDVPNVLHGIAELATCHARAQAVVADADSVVLVHICKVVLSLSHGADEDTDALLGPYVLDVIFDPDDIRIVTEGDFSTIGRKMVRDGILNDFE